MRKITYEPDTNADEPAVFEWVATTTGAWECYLVRRHWERRPDLNRDTVEDVATLVASMARSVETPDPHAPLLAVIAAAKRVDDVPDGGAP